MTDPNQIVDEPGGPVAELVRSEFQRRTRAILEAKDALVAALLESTTAATDEAAIAAFRRKLLDHLNGLRATVLAAIDPFDRPDVFINEAALSELASILARGLDPDG